jgi:hypothetical protein
MVRFAAKVEIPPTEPENEVLIITGRLPVLVVPV